MKKILLILAAFVLVSFTAADWVRVSIDSRASVLFPKKAEAQTVGQNQMWQQGVDSNERCMALIIDFGQFGLDSAGVAAEMGKEETFDQFSESMIGQMEGAEFVSKEKTTENGRLVFKYTVDVSKMKGMVYKRMFSRNVFVGDKLYSLSYYVDDTKPSANTARFLNSLEVK